MKPVQAALECPLGHMQRPLWTSQRRHPESPLMTMVKLSHFDGPVDPDRLAAAFAEVVAASDALSSRVVDVGGSPVVRRDTVHAVSEMLELDRDAVLDWARDRARRPIDPTQCGYDSVVVSHPDGTVSWYLGLHHLVTDATSSALVFDATAAAYFDRGFEVGSYRAWLDDVERDTSPKVTRARDAWRSRAQAPGLGGLYTAAREPGWRAERVDLAGRSGLLERVRSALDSDYRMMTDELSWTAFLLTATTVMVSKVTGGREFSIGLPVHNRSGDSARSVVGAMVELFPVDVSVEAHDTFSTLHRRVGKSLLRTLRHAVPGTSPAADFEVVVNVIPNVGLGQFGDITTNHHAIYPEAVDSSQLLRVSVNAYGDEDVAIVLELNRSGADESHRRRAPQHMSTVIEAMCSEPGMPVGSVGLCTAEELEILARWGNCVDFVSPTPPLIESLRTQLVTRTDVVLEGERRSLTGAELWSEAVSIATWLRESGIGPGSRVGLLLPRSVDAVLAIVAVLRSGAAYVPLDPAQPASRIEALVERAGCDLVLDQLPDTSHIPFDDNWPDPEPEAEAYVLFTSGSTGEPKGVPITQEAVARHLRFAFENYCDTSSDLVVPVYSALTFDHTVTSLLLPLVYDGKGVVITPSGAEALSVLAARTDINWIKATPSHVEVLMRLLPEDHGIEVLVVGGEALGASLADRCLHRFPDLQLFNSYGPTEAAIACMLHRVHKAELDKRPEVPIGAPSNGVSLMVVDDHLNRVPLGGLGEICISHVGLTQGYLGEPTPQLSAPFVEMEGRRYYRTGDLARLVDDSTLVYQGRRDSQVKVGGIRLEPVEVEGALEAHPRVAKAAVRLAGGGDGTPEFLTAWFVSAEDARDDSFPAVELRSFLARTLPAHAIPVAFVQVSHLPATSNGKLDERALPPPTREHRALADGIRERPSPTEQRIIDVWEELLGLTPIGVHDDFFVIGGDSLAAMHMMVSVAEVVGTVVSEDLAFIHTTPRSLAAAIELATSVSTTSNAPAQTDFPVTGPRPSVGESAILLDDALTASPGRYNVGHLFTVRSAIDRDRFLDALADAACLHVPLSWTHGPDRHRLDRDQLVEACQPEPPMAPAELPGLLERWHRPPMDPTGGPAIRCGVQPLTDGSTAVLLVMHHVSIDAEATRLLWAEVDALYHGTTVEAPDVDYPSFALWQESSVTEEDKRFWNSRDYPSASWMFDRPEPALPDGYVSRRAEFTADQLNGAPDGTGFSVMLAALAVASSRRMDSDAVGVGVVASTRNHPVADSLVGYLLNTLPLVVECPPQTSFAGVARAAGDESRRGLAHRTYAYADMVRDRRDRGEALPRIDVMLAYDSAGASSFGGELVEDRVLFNGYAVADTATLFVNVDGSKVDLSMEFSGHRMSLTQAEQFLADVEAAARVGLADPETLVCDMALPSGGSSRLEGTELEVEELVWPAISAQIESRKQHPAVVCGSETLTWEALGARSLELAAALVDAGVEPGDRVVLCLPRSNDLIAGIVACLRLGASYVPIDPTYPSERIRLIARKAGATVGLVSSTDAVTNLDLDPAGVGRLHGGTELATSSSLGSDAEAYVIFTSGSTGEPRGVPVSIGQLAASTAARLRVYEDQPGRFMLVSSLAFDSSVAGLFWTLFTGGTIVLPTEDQVRDPEALLQLISECHVSHTLVVPTLYAALLERGEGQLAWPEQAVVAGEACPKSLVDKHFRLRPGSRLANEYGPTEATVWSTVHHCSPDDGDAPIGKPIPGAWVEIVDANGESVPAGVRGELIVGGPGVVKGYLDDPIASRERFGDGDLGRYFRTGDAAAIVDGVVVYRGRLDNQLNLGGVRAEPEEVEATILRDPAVRAVIVTATDPRSLQDLVDSADPSDLGRLMTEAATTTDPAAFLEQELRRASDQKQLVAHLEATNGARIELKPLKSRLRDELPGNLQPRKIVVHDQLPRTANGKLDRDAAAKLPIPEESAESGIAPGDDVLGQVMARFREALGVSDVAPDESLFDLGGHSLIALRLLDRIEETFGVRISVAELYQQPTPRGVADLLDGADAVSGRQEFVVTIQPEGSRPPLFGVHVLGTNAAYYRPLSSALGPDQPVFGLGIASALEDATAPTEVARISALYAEEVERVAPEGKVVLAAVSIGSAVAFDLADQLAARGREVALVALFDAAGPATGRRRSSTRISRHLQQFRDQPVSYISRRLARVRLRLTRRFERIEKRAREIAGLPLPDRLRIRGFVEANVRAAASHVVSPRHHPMVVFRAAEDPFGHGREDPTMGWGDTALGGLEVIDCPGGHVSMLAEPHVAVLAVELQQAIDRAMATGSVADDERRFNAATGPVVLDLDDVETRLREELARGGFSPAVSELVRQQPEMSDGATALVEAADRTTRSIARHAQGEARRIGERFGRAGFAMRMVPVPDRLTFAACTIQIGDDPSLLEGLVELLAELDYHPHHALSGGASLAYHRCYDTMTFVNHDPLTARVSVRWRESGPGGSRRPWTPTTADLDWLAVPGRAWPLYWALRPLRLVLDRTQGRRAGGNLGPFLGTPSDLVLPILRFAEVNSDDILIDVGCGDGRVVAAAVGALGCKAIGIELDEGLASKAAVRVRDLGLDDRATILHSDAAGFDYSEASTVFAFLPAPITARILEVVLPRLRPGARFIAHEQEAVKWPIEPTRSQLIVEGGITVAHVWERP